MWLRDARRCALSPQGRPGEVSAKLRKERTLNRLIVLAALSVAGSALISCNPLEPRACTLIGCNSGLRVEIEGTPSGPFTLTATAGGASESVSCEQGTACDLFFEDLTPSQVTISYESGGEEIEQTFSPSYTRSRPNGEDCPPECVNGTVVLELP